MHTTASPTQLGLDHAPGLMRLARRLAGGTDAEDLVQSTYVRALEQDAPVLRQRSWLSRVLVNERNMAVRARVRRADREQAVTDVAGAPIDVEHVVHSLEVARVVQDLVDELDDDVQLVVRERYFEGSSAADIARRHEIPAGTVRWRLKTGLDRLRDQLDARYGGRRALWAGGLIPQALAPTLPSSVASQPATAGGTSSAAAKGTSAMSVMSAKLLLGAAVLVGGTATTAALMSPSDDANETAAEVANTAESATVAKATPTKPVLADGGHAPGSPPPEWTRRRSQIRAAFAAAGAEQKSAGPELDDDEEEPCEGGPHVGACLDEECVNELVAQVSEMFVGCQEFMTDMPADLALSAKVIGAPDVGSVVESVELSSDEDTSEELRECLTQAMYTLDLGPAESNFEQEVMVMLGTEALNPGDPKRITEAEYREFWADKLDEETRAVIEAALEEHGGEGEGEVYLQLDHEAVARGDAAPPHHGTHPPSAD